MRIRAIPLLFSCLLLACQPQPPPLPPPAPTTSAVPGAPAPPEPVAWPCPQQADVDGDGQADRLELSLRRAAVVTAEGAVPLGLPPPAVERMCMGDLDGDEGIEIVASVVRPTTKDETFRRRLFVYEMESRRLRPEFLGTQGAGELVHFGLADLDEDGKLEVLVRERTEEGAQSRAFRWTGFQLTERPELAHAVLPYRHGPRWLATPHFSPAAERLSLPGAGQLSFSRAPAQSRPVKLGTALSSAVNRGKYPWLSAAARRKLARDGFVVVRPGQAPDEFHSLYIRNQYEGLPSFVTADTALHLTHLLLDDVLERAEREVLGPALQRVVTGMGGQGRLLLPRLSPELAAALDRVLFRLDVAAALLEGHSLGLAGPRAQQVEAELERIDRRGVGSGALSQVDYRGFVVRGHYAKNPALERYFKAMLLLSLAPTEGSLESALLTALAVSDPTHRALLTLLDDFGRALVGPPANRSVLDVVVDARGAFGQSPRWEQLAAERDWRRSPTPHAAKPLGAELTLLARRWPVDNDLLALEPQRPALPDPLQVLAALGSQRAREQLAATLSARPKLARELAGAEAALRSGRLGDSASIGGRFLLSLRWLLLPYPEGYPAFQRTPAWSDHNMVSAAAAWTEWRRDTILYVQPPVVWLEGGDEDELPPGKAGFVEPVPELYQELAGVLSGAGQLLRAIGFEERAETHTRGRGRLALRAIDETHELMRFLEEAARAELAGQGLKREQRERLSGIGPWLEAVLAGDGTLKLPPVPVIADISYVKDPARILPDQVLSIGTGPVDVIVVAMPLGRRVVLARGAVSSFFELTTDGPKTDAQWRAQLAAGRAPPQPPWAKPVALPRYRRLGASSDKSRLRNFD